MSVQTVQSEMGWKSEQKNVQSVRITRMVVYTYSLWYRGEPTP
jgi:hypothetical protein